MVSHGDRWGRRLATSARGVDPRTRLRADRRDVGLTKGPTTVAQSRHRNLELEDIRTEVRGVMAAMDAAVAAIGAAARTIAAESRGTRIAEVGGI
jgi:hypothetical protein